jgi:hypothetical protein
MVNIFGAQQRHNPEHAGRFSEFWFGCSAWCHFMARCHTSSSFTLSAWRHHYAKTNNYKLQQARGLSTAPKRTTKLIFCPEAFFGYSRNGDLSGVSEGRKRIDGFLLITSF